MFQSLKTFCRKKLKYFTFFIVVIAAFKMIYYSF